MIISSTSIDDALDSSVGDKGLSKSSLDRGLKELAPALDKLRHWHDSNELPLFQLPKRRDDLEMLKPHAERLAKFEHVVVMGSGGSSLSGKTLVALLAGVALGLTWQPYGWWPLLAVAIPAFTLAVRGLRPRRAFGLGYLFGLVMLTVAVSWLHVLGMWVAAVLILFESLFFGLLVALNLQTAFLSPPVAMAAFYLKGVSPPHVTLNQIFAGMLLFMGIQIIAIFMLYVFPEIGLWLPSVLYGR